MKNAFHGTARKIIRTDTAAGVRVEYCYHNTAVVRSRPDGTIALHSGGWQTATTKRAINQALEDLDRSERVKQIDGSWFICNGPHRLKFFDDIVLTT